MTRRAYRPLALLLFAAFAFPAQGSGAVAGWQNFRLGMSLEEVQAAATDISWSEYGLASCREGELRNRWGCVVSAQDYETRVGDLTFRLSARFDEKLRLTSIQLENKDSSGVSASECHTRFRYILEPLENKYGQMNGTTKKLFRDDEMSGEREPVPLEQRNTPLGGSYMIPEKQEDYKLARLTVSTDVASYRKAWSIEDQRPYPPHVNLLMEYNYKEISTACVIEVYYQEGFEPESMESQL